MQRRCNLSSKMQTVTVPDMYLDSEGPESQSTTQCTSGFRRVLVCKEGREEERLHILELVTLGLRALRSALASLKVTWQAPTRQEAPQEADLRYVCSVVAWPCPVR